MKRNTWIAFATCAALGLLSGLFARPILEGLAELGVLPRRGLAFPVASDAAFGLAVFAGLLALWAMVRVSLALAGRVPPPLAASIEEDPRYRELLRQKEALLRDLMELQFDRELRKISDEDFASIEGRLRRDATAILQALDECDPVRIYGERIRDDLRPYLIKLEAERKPAIGEAPHAHGASA